MFSSTSITSSQKENGIRPILASSNPVDHCQNVNRMDHSNWDFIDKDNVFSLIWGRQIEDDVKSRKEQLCATVNEKIRLERIAEENRRVIVAPVTPPASSVPRKTAPEQQSPDVKKAKVDPVPTTRALKRTRKPVRRYSPSRDNTSSEE